MGGKQVIERWVECFNTGDVDKFMALYADDAVQHAVFAEPMVGKPAIRAQTEAYFAAAKLHCIVENLVATEDGWVVLEWLDRVGLKGCNVYRIEDGLIKVQRSYFDQLSFFKLNGLPVPPMDAATEQAT